MTSLSHNPFLDTVTTAVLEGRGLSVPAIMLLAFVGLCFLEGLVHTFHRRRPQ